MISAFRLSFLNPSISSSCRKVCNSIPNHCCRPVCHLHPVPLGFKCKNLSVQHRRLQGVDSFSHRLLKSLPGRTQRSKEGNIHVDIGKGDLEVVVQVLKVCCKGVDMDLNRGGGCFCELVEVPRGHCSSCNRNSAMFLSKAGPNITCRLELIKSRA